MVTFCRALLNRGLFKGVLLHLYKTGSKLLVLFFVVAVLMFSQNTAYAAITYLASASNPLDGSNSLSASPVAVTPPGSMSTGDLVILVANSRVNSATMSMSGTGGQLWTAQTNINSTGSQTIFWARFNGTWPSNPSVAFSDTISTTVVMHVFRPSSGSNTWEVDVSQTSSASTPSGKNDDVTIGSITTNTNGALVFATWTSTDNNQWSLQTSGWTNAGGGQYRNGASSDASQSSAYKVMPTVGSSGSVVNRQSSGGPDDGNISILAFREVSGPSPTITSISPASGPTAGGTAVTINGNNFTGLTGASAVKFGGSNATSYTVNSATQIVATAPPGAGTVDVTVTTPGGTSATSTADQFTYIAAPIAEYRFDETSGSTVTDSSGNNLSGALNGGVTVGGSGQVCTGYNFNGSNAFVSVPNTTLLNPTKITVAAWVRHSTDPIKSWETIVAKGDSAYRLHLNGGCSINSPNPAGGISFAVNGGCGTADINSQIVPKAGRWYHVVGTYDGAAIKIYVDGTLQASAAYASTVGSNGFPLYIGENAERTGRFFSGDIDEVKIYGVALSAAQIAAGYANEKGNLPSVPPKNWDGTARVCAATGPDHLEIQHATGSGVTCAPSTLTIKACADTLVPCTAYTGGVSGTLSPTGAPNVNWVGGSGFSIGSSGSVDKSVQITTPGSVAFGVSSATPTPISATTCKFGASTSCTFTATDAGAFVVAVPSHRSCVAQAPMVTVPAACGVALDGAKSIGFRFTYVNPNTGATPIPHVPYAGLAAPGAPLATGSDVSVNLAFTNGVATLPYFIYDDAGSLTLTASYAGSGTDAGLSMTGTSPAFVAAPASFAFSAIPVAPLTAGLAFNATVTAKNACAVPAPTPNFIKQTVTITSSNPLPAMGNATAINTTLTGFSNGTASTNLTWNEVGTIDLNANLANYLGSTLSVSGTQAGVGRFIPHHFDTVITQPGTTFTYSGQPFITKVTAMNSAGTPTTNYNATAGFSKDVTLSAWDSTGVTANPGPGVLTPAQPIVLASAFTSTSTGAATVATPTYTFTAAKTAPMTIRIRATDTDLVSSSDGVTEGTAVIRSGRLRVSNAFGSEKSNLSMAVSAEYWTGLSWLLNSADSFSLIPTTAVALTPSGVVGSTVQGNVTLVGGQASIVLLKPTSGTGMVDLAINLGSGTADLSCLTTHPATTGAGLPWLRSLNGSCAATYDRDPSARATFGIYSPETRKTIHVRELY